MLPSRIVINVPAHRTTRDAQREYVRGDRRVLVVLVVLVAFDPDSMSAVMAA
jgi:hypothetical protein